MDKAKLKIFEVYASERVFYRIRVEAESEQEARELVMSGNVEVGDAEDSEDFVIDEVAEITPQGLPVK